MRTSPPHRKHRQSHLRRFDELFVRDELTVAGLDEAGRGPWAGPVVAAAVVLPEKFDLPGLNDSKLLSSAKREILYSQITSCALFWAAAVVEPSVIDQLNILTAAHTAMVQALTGISAAGGLALIDGPPIPQVLFGSLSWRQISIIGGDRKSARIAAASILAKVTRDRIMRELDRRYPEYGFAKHKGYGTPEHQEALKRYGPCDIHRKSFAPVREVLVG